MDKISQGIWMGTFTRPNDPALFPIDGHEALDIDYRWQFYLCESLYLDQFAGS